MIDLLKTHFGYDSFLPLQEEIIGAVMGGQDCFVLMPTGGGKSLCYQLPAMTLPGLTLVVSPLIALMKDQVDALEANELPAAYINSTQTPDELRQVVRQLRAGEIRLLYVAPERVTEPRFAGFLQTLDVSLVAIDEAHCVSEWGHEFRPAYRELAGVRRTCPNAPVIALTATATERVRADVLSQLGLRNPKTFISSFNRPNLTYSVEPKERGLSSLLPLLERHRGGSAIIYCGSRKATEEVTQTLSGRGFIAEAYHAGLEPETRRSVQDRFIRDRTPIVVATIAFGMGINKPDVRLVAHYDLPKSVEGYYQETGRAGRDGLPSECVLYFSYGGKSRQEYFINQIEDAEERERARERLEQVISLCSLSSCRRKFVLEYLGEEWPDVDCDNCDNCTQPREEYDATEIAQKVLSAVIRTGERFGAAHVIGVLRGSRSKRIRQQEHDQLPVYGIAANHSRDELRDLTEELKREGLLSASDGEYQILAVPPKGREFLKNRETLTLSRPLVERKETVAELAVGDTYAEALLHELRSLRRQIADHNGVPAYVVFNDKSLREMAKKVPLNRQTFARISGVGEVKLREYGGPFLKVINDYVRKHGISGTTDVGQQRASLKSSSGSAAQSYMETRRIIAGGASLEETASARGLSTQTIVGHLERLVESGIDVQWSHLLPPPERRAEIENALEIMGDNPLRPVWEELGGECSYNEIRLVRLARRFPDLPDATPAPDPRSMLRFDR